MRKLLIFVFLFILISFTVLPIYSAELKNNNYTSASRLSSNGQILFDNASTIDLQPELQTLHPWTLTAFTLLVLVLSMGINIFKGSESKSINQYYSLLASILISIGLAISGILAPIHSNQSFYQGISINNITLANLTKDEAQDFLEISLKKKISFLYHEQIFIFSLNELGLEFNINKSIDEAYSYIYNKNLWQRWFLQRELLQKPVNFPISFTLNENALTSILTNQLLPQIERAAKNASFELVDQQVVVHSDQPGIRIDIKELINQIYQWQNSKSSSFIIPIQPVQAEVSKEKLQALLPMTLISTYTTEFVDNANRTENIRVASTSIHGTILKPGQIFSFNETVGPREAERGYKVAIIIQGGQFVPGLGGGVCQVSSTLYNSCLEAGLEIIERHPHSLPINYVPKGKDASVYYPTGDFQFKNNTDKYLLLTTAINGWKLTINIYESKKF